MTTVNRRITLAARPRGLPRISDFRLDFAGLPVPLVGEVVVQSVYLSLDPGMRRQMDAVESFDPTVILGEVMAGGAVGSVVESRDGNFRVGEIVAGMFGWQEYAVIPGVSLRRIDPDVAPISTALGVLGIPGLTAYFGLLQIGQPHRGETVLVSGAADAVGMIVGQIAKIEGCCVVGVAGAEAKVAWLLDELDFDGAFNYKTAPDFHSKLAELCSGGIDVYFDNVGGAITDAAMGQINEGARVVVCGQISQYNLVTPELGPRWLGQLVIKQARVQGFRVATYVTLFAEGLAQLTTWMRQGKLNYREDVAQGIEAAPQAFIAMLEGKNQGKQLVQLSAS
ncbi:MAG: NADP-dependent oxidoreductase [Thermoanaerobaculia bacterium]|nr:NADP-dependent oxidoreductase [Thermoanaerobaculia bacterium]